MATDLEEGDVCHVEDCPGQMKYVRHGDCSCHISPPCSNCVDAPLECSHCGWNPGEANNGN